MGQIHRWLKVWQSRVDFWRSEQGSKPYGISHVAERFIHFYEEQIDALKRQQGQSENPK